jgi:hypothetical protein
VVALLGGGWWFLRNGSDTDRVKPTPAAQVDPPTQPVVVPPPAKPATVKLEIRATPAEAKIQIDGKDVANPYSTTAPADGKDAHVSITATGYQPYEVVAKLDRDLLLAKELEPVAAPTNGHKSGHPKLPSAPPLDGKTDSHKPEVKPAGKPEAKSDSPKHDEGDKGPTIYKGTKSKLDESDPWTK